MALKFYFYGTVAFTGPNTQQANGKRNSAGQRLDNRATQAGFTPDVYSAMDAWFPDLAAQFGPWPAGRQNITFEGAPALRFSYSTMDPVIAEAAMNDVVAWDVFQQSNSSWGTAAVTVPD